MKGIFISISGVREKLAKHNECLEVRKREQVNQVVDMQDLFRERAKVEARYVKDLEKVAKDFRERKLVDALG